MYLNILRLQAKLESINFDFAFVMVFKFFEILCA